MREGGPKSEIEIIEARLCRDLDLTSKSENIRCAARAALLEFAAGRLTKQQALDHVMHNMNRECDAIEIEKEMAKK